LVSVSNVKNERKNVKLAVDCDGVVYDFIGLLTKEYNKPWPTQWSFMKDWDVSYTLYEEWLRTPRFFSAGKPISGAVRNLTILAEKGAEVTFLTARRPEVRTATEAWLAAHFKFDYELELADLGQHKDGGHRFDFAIDDKKENCVSLADTGCPNVILFDQTWNRDAADHPNVQRVASWSTIRLLIEHEMERRCSLV
jgi:uncharacterized HAD superfamily protein